MYKRQANLENSAQRLKSLSSQFTLRNLTGPVRSALMFQPAGIISSYTAALSTLRMQLQMKTITQALKHNLNRYEDSLNQIADGLDVRKRFNALTDEIEAQANRARRSTTEIWNESMSMLNHRPIPPAAKMNSMNADRMTSLMDNLYRRPSSGSFECVPLRTATQDLTLAMMAKTNVRDLRWVPVDSTWDYTNLAVESHGWTAPKVSSRHLNDTDLVPVQTTYRLSTDQAARAISMLDVELDYAEQRERDMYNTQWN